mgnify:CR=1 FL=1
MPALYYVISTKYGNNFFQLIVNNQATIIEIPSGNYDTTTIFQVINNEINLLGAPFNLVEFAGNLYGITGSAQTMVGPKANDGSVTSGKLATDLTLTGTFTANNVIANNTYTKAQVDALIASASTAGKNLAINTFFGS